MLPQRPSFIERMIESFIAGQEMKMRQESHKMEREKLKIAQETAAFAKQQELERQQTQIGLFQNILNNAVQPQTVGQFPEPVPTQVPGTVANIPTPQEMANIGNVNAPGAAQALGQRLASQQVASGPEDARLLAQKFLGLDAATVAGAAEISRSQARQEQFEKDLEQVINVLPDEFKEPIAGFARLARLPGGAATAEAAFGQQLRLAEDSLPRTVSQDLQLQNLRLENRRLRAAAVHAERLNRESATRKEAMLKYLVEFGGYKEEEAFALIEAAPENVAAGVLANVANRDFSALLGPMMNMLFQDGHTPTPEDFNKVRILAENLRGVPLTQNQLFLAAMMVEAKNVATLADTPEDAQAVFPDQLKKKFPFLNPAEVESLANTVGFRENRAVLKSNPNRLIERLGITAPISWFLKWLQIEPPQTRFEIEPFENEGG